MNEKEIIRRCQDGEKEAFNALIRTYYPYVTKYLLKLSNNADLTEDLTQDVFLKVIRSIDTFNLNGKAAFATYMITIAKNTFIDYTRQNKVQFSELSETDVQAVENVETKVLSNLTFDEITKYIDSLPPNQASVIRLKYIDEYTLKEIESITGVPVKTVKSRIHEGTKKLRSLLKRNGRG